MPGHVIIDFILTSNLRKEYNHYPLLQKGKLSISGMN
jgi:hypothetical protein